MVSASVLFLYLISECVVRGVTGVMEVSSVLSSLGFVVLGRFLGEVSATCKMSVMVG